MNSAEFEKKYPKYCKRCKGWGLFKSPNPSLNECNDCIGKELCARCGEKIDVMYNCNSCGWNSSDENRGLPGSSVW